MSAKVKLVAGAVFACLLLGALVSAPANAWLLAPPKKKVYWGVSDTGDPADFGEFSNALNKHPAVIQSFRTWGSDFDESIRRWQIARARPMIHISTAGPHGEVITPRGIARGKGDGYLVDLNRIAAESRHVLYIRLMAEMNAHWNPYSAFDASGRFRGASHSTRAFRRAWRRVVIVV
ncbi:MAG: hypothetical protein M3335_08500, partial [Actinomycetota bacterium]|nr:hypothetical protein [Actinomycetota bacterium]